MQEILERFLLSAALAAAFAGAAMAIAAGNRVWARYRHDRSRIGRIADPANPTLLCFTSAGCAQCADQERQIEQARTTLGRRGRILAVRKLDAHEERDLARSMHVITVPTTVLLDAGGNIAAWNPGLTRSQTIVSQFETMVRSPADAD